MFKLKCFNKRSKPPKNHSKQHRDEVLIDEDDEEALADLNEIDRENLRPPENQASICVNQAAKKVSQTKEASKSTKTKSLLKVKSTQRSTDADCEEDAEPRTSTTATVTRKQGKKRSSKVYRPGYRSGAYAILVTLYNHEKETVNDEDARDYMLKVDLIKEAQQHCNSSFVNVSYKSKTHI